MVSDKFNNVLASLIVLIIVVALVNLSVTFIKISKQNEELTGHATGYVNITIATAIAMNLSRDTVDFGVGGIDGGWDNATLYTNGDNNATVIGGNWSVSRAKAIIIQNIGTVNFSLNLSFGKNATGFFGGTNPLYQFNISNNISTTCGDPGEWALGTWVDVNESQAFLTCNKFYFMGPNNYMYLDIKIRVPKDVNTTIASNTNIFDTINIVANPAI
jgi:hypothetical protein